MASELNSMTVGEVRITTSLNDNGDYMVVIYDAVTGEDLRIIDGQYTPAQLAQRRVDRPYHKVHPYIPAAIKITLPQNIAEEYHTLDSDELDRLVHEHLGVKNYNCVAAEEWSNDSEHTYPVRISDVDGVNAPDYKSLQDFVQGKSKHCFWGTLAAELARQEVIPEGNYIISVCW